MDSLVQRSRMALWIVFIAFCAVMMANQPLIDTKPLGLGIHTYYAAAAALAGLLGFGVLLRTAGGPKGIARWASRIIVVYVLYEILVVAPIALYLGTTNLQGLIHDLAIRFTWLLFPVVLVLCRDSRTRRTVGLVVIVAAVCVALWGLFSLAAYGGGFYSEDGDTRFRVLWGGATLLFAWPFVVAASGLAAPRWTLPLLAVGLVGLVLTNHRTGIIAFALVGVFCVVASGRMPRLVAWLVPTALAGVVVLLVWGDAAGRLLGYNVAHVLDFGAGNGLDRLVRWRAAWEYVSSVPFNDWTWSGGRWYPYPLPGGYGPHNFFLEIGATEGIAGLAYYGVLLSAVFAAGWKWVRTDAIVRACVGYLLAYWVFCFGNATMYQLANIALMVGCVGALVARLDQLRTSQPEGPLTNGSNQDGQGVAA